jgi:hypothetical protein
MSDLAYFEYALVLPEERYLIEVQTRKPDSGELLAQEEIEGIAKECLVLVIGEGHADEVKDVKPNSISESQAQNLRKVQQLLNRPDGAVFLVESGEIKSPLIWFIDFDQSRANRAGLGLGVRRCWGLYETFLPMG